MNFILSKEMMTSKMLSHSRYPLTNNQAKKAADIAPALAKKAMEGARPKIDIDALCRYYKIDKEDAIEIIKWFEDGCINTTFEY